MKAVCLLFMIFFMWGTDVSAQVVDMRAYSRQRGFKAYRAKTPAPVQKRQAAPAAGQNRQAVPAGNAQVGESGKSDNKKSADSLAQTAEMREYIQNNPHVRPDI